VTSRDWWREGVLYQIYPRSFADSNGDGVGDLDGIIAKLDHLAWLGIDGIWLSPINPSPGDDIGYDVSDYCDVQPEYGDLAALDRLIAEAGRRGIRLLLDLVPNHTSDRHPWFVESSASRSSRRRDWYVWADPASAGGPPNNWVSVFGGPAWSYDERTAHFYLHQFLPSQPDLNWWNDEVRAEFDRILRFWFDRGVAGFRIDTANRIVKDRLLRDNPAIDDSVHAMVRRLGQKQLYNAGRPELHDLLRRWRRVADEYDPARILVGETWLFDYTQLAAFYGASDDELHLAFNFLLVHADFEPRELCAVVEATEAALPGHAWPVWTGSNHDVSRLPTRWARGDERLARSALVMLLTLRGTPVLYYGDEIAMPDVEVPAERTRDPLFHRFPDARRGRDPERTPMHWSPASGAGFTKPDVEPWLPFGDLSRNVERQRADPASTLNLVRDLIELRRRHTDLRRGSYATVPAVEGVWAWRRGEGTGIAINFSIAALPQPFEGEVLIGTDRQRDGSQLRVDDPIDGSSAVVVALTDGG
jgi:alpha-glucosidase